MGKGIVGASEEEGIVVASAVEEVEEIVEVEVVAEVSHLLICFILEFEVLTRLPLSWPAYNQSR